MAAVDLRPLSLGQVLDRTFAVYRSNFWLFVGIMAVPSCAALPFSLLLLLRNGSAVPLIRPNAPQQSAAFFLVFFAFLFIFWAIYTVAMAAATYAVSDVSLGKTATVRGSYGKVRGHFWRLMGLFVNLLIRLWLFFFVVAFVAVIIAGIVGTAVRSGGGVAAAAAIGVLVFVGFTAAFVFWVWFALRYSVSVSALLLEDTKIGVAIRRSVELTRGNRGRIFVAFLLCAVVGYVGVLIFQGPFWVAALLLAAKSESPRWLLFVTSVSGAIGGSLTGPVTMIVLVLCYYDLRIRKEGFDLQYKMAALGEQPPPNTPTVSLG